jgi:hypothetical protein
MMAAMSAKGNRQKDEQDGGLIKDALSPFKAASVGLYERAVAYVRSGAGPEVLLEIPGADPDLPVYFDMPGRLQSWYYTPQAASRALKGVGVDPRKVREYRSRVYASTAIGAERFVRMARVLAAFGGVLDRATATVPDWFTLFVNDVTSCMSERRHSGRGFDWSHCTPEWLTGILAAGDVPADDIPPVLITACFQSESSSAWGPDPKDLPGAREYLVTHGHLYTPVHAAALRAAGKAGLAEVAKGRPEAVAALAPLLTGFAVDQAKGPRTAAIAALEQVPFSQVRGFAEAVLVSAPAARAGELVEFVARSDGGADLLRDVAASGAKAAKAIEEVLARHSALNAAPPTDETFELPPYELPADVPAGEDVAGALREFLRKEIERGAAPDAQQWARERAGRARSITEDDIAAFCRCADTPAANATESLDPTLLRRLTLWQLQDSVKPLTLVHLLRLAVASAQRGSWQWVIGFRADSGTDLRTIADAARIAGADIDLPALVLSGFTSPEAAWPWLSDHLDVLQGWLTESASSTKTALAVLAEFPVLPSRLLPALSAVAVGSSRVNRPLAQDVLRRKSSALPLAEQALTNSKAELRVAAAEWLTRIGDPAAVLPLRTALAKEKREIARAALLTALESLGDDISADLSPATLLAEAAKGTRARPPASMAWFPLDSLPAARWADGTPVDPVIVRWWVTLAVKLKDPDGSGLIDRYLSLLHPDDAAALGRFVLSTWIAHDTRRPDPAESRVYADTEGPRRWQANQDWLARARTQKDASYLPYAEQAAAVPVERHTADAYAEHQSNYLGSATVDKGMIALSTRMPGYELASAVQSYIAHHGGRRAQVEYLVHALFANGDPVAVQLLLAISRRFKQATVQAKAKDLVEQLAERRGWTADELADRTIPTAGFGDDGMLRLSYGPREFIGRINAKAGIDLATADGKAIKGLPAKRVTDDDEAVAAAKKQLAASRREVKAVIAQQTARLYEAMCLPRRWAVADWAEFLAGHPIMRRLIAGLVWIEETTVADEPGTSLRSFRPTEDGEFIDLDDEPIELAPESRILVAHRVLLGGDVSEQWRLHLADYGVNSLFAQLDNDSPLTDPEGTGVTATTTEITALQGHMTDTFSFRGVAGKRGYVRGGAEDGGWFSEYSKDFASAGLKAVITFTGSFLPEENITCATESLLFRRGRREIPAGDVPPILLAETYADYAALAALGPYDAAYRKKSEY